MLLTIDCDTDQIRQEHLDEFNQTLSRQQWCHTNTKFRVPNQCWTVSHHRDGTVSLDGLQLRNQPLIQNCIRRRTHYWQSDNIQRINNLPNHISAKIFSWQVQQRFFSTTTDEDGSHIWFDSYCVYMYCLEWCIITQRKYLFVTVLFYYHYANSNSNITFIGAFVQWLDAAVGASFCRPFRT